MSKRILFFLVAIVLVSCGGYYVWGQFQRTANIDPPQPIAVKRGLFVHEILARGSVDSAKNEDIRCRVESAGYDGLVIVYVIPEGTLVKKGDLLIELESSRLDENAERQRVTVIGSESNVNQAIADLKNAELTLREYLETTFIQQQKTIENEKFAADEAMRTQEEMLSHYERLYDRGHITRVQVDAALTEYEKAQNTYDIAQIKLEGLETYTKEKMVTQYEASIESCRMALAAAEQVHLINKNRLAHLERQLANCKIYAPSDGQVVYFMPRWAGEDLLIREGRKVIDKEVLLQLPDPTQMQVKGLVNEANVRFVREGQRATIRLEAFLNQTFEGVVTEVKTMPEPSSWQGGGAMSREYLATVKIVNPPEGVRTGLTAEARIIVSEVSDVLLLPAQSVFTHSGKTYVVTFNEGVWDKIEVKTGPSNDREVVILEGLNEGDEVVLGGWVHRDKLNLPRIIEDPRRDTAPEEEELFRERMRQEEMQHRGASQMGGNGSILQAATAMMIQRAA